MITSLIFAKAATLSISGLANEDQAIAGLLSEMQVSISLSLSPHPAIILTPTQSHNTLSFITPSPAMAPYYSTRDPFAGTQVHSKSIYPRGSGSPLLVSSSIRAASSPRLVHGNSPLLKAVNVTPASEDVEAFASPGQFSDADFDEGPSECYW